MLSDWTQFTNGQWGYYLMSGSPAIDSGNNSLAVDALGQPLTEDIYGNPRIVNSTVDIVPLKALRQELPHKHIGYQLDQTIAADGVLTFIEAFEAAQK